MKKKKTESPSVRPFRETVIARIKRDKEFRRMMLMHGFVYYMLGMDDEEVFVGRSSIKDYIDATLGFEKLSEKTSIPVKSLLQMFNAKGNPSHKNLNLIFRALFQQEKLKPENFLHGKNLRAA